MLSSAAVVVLTLRQRQIANCFRTVNPSLISKWIMGITPADQPSMAIIPVVSLLFEPVHSMSMFGFDNLNCPAKSSCSHASYTFPVMSSTSPKEPPRPSFLVMRGNRKHGVGRSKRSLVTSSRIIYSATCQTMQAVPNIQ